MGIPARDPPLSVRRVHAQSEGLRVTTDDDERDAPICPRCGGSGEVTGMAGAGPDAYTIDVECSTCAGTGSAVDSSSPNPAECDPRC